jgi:hypothetical protein
MIYNIKTIFIIKDYMMVMIRDNVGISGKNINSNVCEFGILYFVRCTVCY